MQSAAFPLVQGASAIGPRNIAANRLRLSGGGLQAKSRGGGGFVHCPVKHQFDDAAGGQFFAAAREALDSGRRVIVVSQPPIGTRDFCQGAAVALYRDLVRSGAIEVADGDEAVAMIEEWERP